MLVAFTCLQCNPGAGDAGLTHDDLLGNQLVGHLD